MWSFAITFFGFRFVGLLFHMFMFIFCLWPCSFYITSPVFRFAAGFNPR